MPSITKLYRAYTPAGLRIYYGGLRVKLAQALHRWPRPPLSAALADLQHAWDIPACPDSPIFVLSAGWRSGSTALQRALNSDDTVLIWGEPFLETGTIQRLAESLAAFHNSIGRFSGHVIDAERGRRDLAVTLDSWTATLCPSPAELIEGHRSLLRATFAEPARRLGRTRWGLKEVRFDADYATYLSMLFPNAKFVVLVRNPLDAYASYRARMVNPWYERWPDRRIAGPRGFAKHWRRLADGLYDFAAGNGALILRYEDLHEPDTLRELEKYLDVRIGKGVLARRVGSSKDSSLYRKRVPRWEARLVRSTTKHTSRLFGYV